MQSHYICGAIRWQQSETTSEEWGKGDSVSEKGKGERRWRDGLHLLRQIWKDEQGVALGIVFCSPPVSFLTLTTLIP